MVQICPHCKRTVPEEASTCPHCKRILSPETVACPFCKAPISGMDTTCPACGKLLIYEYPKHVAAKRNTMLFPLGFLLLGSVAAVWFLRWRNIMRFDGLLGLAVMVIWLVGLAFYAANLGKPWDSWWGR